VFWTKVRGVRGAITVEQNTADEIVSATKELLQDMIKVNNIVMPDVASIIFTVTADLNAQFPAQAARDMGYTETPLLCTNEIAVTGSLGKCIRILMHVNTAKSQKQMKAVYLKKAIQLRPEFSR
jgi:chorismate mutase